MRRNTTGDVRKKYEEEINRYAQMMEDSIEEIDGASGGIQEIKAEISDLRAKNGINESNNWTGGANYSTKWTKEDMDGVTDLINPYKLIELGTKAEIIIENSNDRNSKKLKRTWELLKNDIHKRWYFTYDINKLESKAKTNKALADEKTTPEQKKTTKETMSISMAMKEIFGSSIDIFSSSSYDGLKNNKGTYFLLNVDKKVFLMERLAYIDDKYVYGLIANLSVTEDKKFTVERYFNTPDKGISIKLMNKDFELYKEEDKHPIVIFKRLTNNLYSLPVSSRGDTEYVDLVSLSISSLRDGLNTNGLVIDDTEGLGDWDTSLSEEQIETIKKLKI